MEEGKTNPELTQLIHAWAKGDDSARGRLMSLVYEQVHQIAARALRANAGATLSPTELSHEVLIKLLGAAPNVLDRKHFFNLIAQVSRQVLVDAARKRGSDKRGGLVAKIALTDAGDLVETVDDELLKLDLALNALASAHARCAQIVELSYFGGFSHHEIAASFQIAPITVDRDLRFARAWLKDAMAS